MKHLKWSISQGERTINGVCRARHDLHQLMQKITASKFPHVVYTLNGQSMGRMDARSHLLSLMDEEQSQFEDKHRAIHVKTGACAFAANTKKVWVKR